MWISKRRWKHLEARVAALEGKTQERQKTDVSDITNRLSQRIQEQMKEPHRQQLAIDCMAQHIKEFLTQSAGKEQADFGKTCGDNCPMWRNGQCKDFDWLKNMKPILNQSRVKISVANPLQTNR